MSAQPLWARSSTSEEESSRSSARLSSGERRKSRRDSAAPYQKRPSASPSASTGLTTVLDASNIKEALTWEEVDDTETKPPAPPPRRRRRTADAAHAPSAVSSSAEAQMITAEAAAEEGEAAQARMSDRRSSRRISQGVRSGEDAELDHVGAASVQAPPTAVPLPPPTFAFPPPPADRRKQRAPAEESLEYTAKYNFPNPPKGQPPLGRSLQRAATSSNRGASGAVQDRERSTASFFGKIRSSVRGRKT